ncbi:MAG: hypothetical protein GY757_28580 [bacterium]|nr:hypothetical protein [bacterium]
MQLNNQESQYKPGRSYIQQGPPFIIITSPNGVESWRIGQIHTIDWGSYRVPGNVALKLIRNGIGMGYLSDWIPNSGSFLWHIPKLWNGVEIMAGENYQLFIKSQGENNIYDYSATFKILPE